MCQYHFLQKLEGEIYFLKKTESKYDKMSDG